MAQTLIIVESPKKARTLEAFLGKQQTRYQVLASNGHVRDLLPKKGAVDPDNSYAMQYQTLESHEKQIQKIQQAAKKSNQILLATDPDREGEAIAWHVYSLLEEKNPNIVDHIARITFYQITEKAVLEAIANPRAIEQNLVNAQQARRAMDYLVGFNLSPWLWKKIRPGLSAGRVQSPALKLIVEREAEIQAFQPQEYWDFHAELQHEDSSFKAKLTHWQGEKLEMFSIPDEASAKTIKAGLDGLEPHSLTVTNVVKKQRKRNPSPPFTTATLQQEAARKLGFTTSRTMRLAQGLYEGIELGGEQKGLITYMRTDSVALAQEAIEDIREHVSQTYGSPFIPKEAIKYKTKSKNAQEAHEAIRPTDIRLTPEKLKAHITPELHKLYQLIWQRAVASQMSAARYDQVQVDLNHNDICQFRANGSTLVFRGFLSVYHIQDEEDKTLPVLSEQQALGIAAIIDKQHFTEPPPRYSEASLVKTLEEYGIGRPSTYTSIISTLLKREYVILEQKRFYPTDVGRFVSRILNSQFSQYVDYTFTANMEDSLDAIARGEQEWLPILDGFWRPFLASIEKAEGVSRQEATQEPLDENCPTCEKPLVRKLSRAGIFIACTGYPDCNYTRSEGEEEKQDLGRNCPECQGALTYKHGRFGRFIGCSNYPDCRYIEKEKPKTIEVTCPKCQKGQFVKRQSRRGSPFYACNQYPTCKTALSHEPTAIACSQCQYPITMHKVTKRFGAQRVCPECKHSETLHDTDD